jgi:DNA polymerase III subunit delta'
VMDDDIAEGTGLGARSALFADVADQTPAIKQLLSAARRPVHAYLIIGQSGLQQRELVRGFAAALLCPSGGCGACDTCRRVLSGVHPDLVEIERAGAQLAVDDARRVVRLAYRKPHEASRQVLVVPDLHLARLAAPVLLKTLEEPPPATVLVLLADSLTPELATVASRCVRIELTPVPEAELAAWLLEKGTAGDLAVRAAHAAGGSPERARLLLDDPSVGERRQLWRQVPSRLDGTGATVVRLVEELLDSGSAALEPLRVRQALEIEQLTAQAKASGERGLPGRREIEDRHKREERRLRTDELKAGLAELAAAYRDRAVETSGDPSAHGAQRLIECSTACDLVGATATELVRNPNESLLLQALFVRLAALFESAVI